MSRSYEINTLDIVLSSILDNTRIKYSSEDLLTPYYISLLSSRATIRALNTELKNLTGRDLRSYISIENIDSKGVLAFLMDGYDKKDLPDRVELIKHMENNVSSHYSTYSLMAIYENVDDLSLPTLLALHSR